MDCVLRTVQIACSVFWITDIFANIMTGYIGDGEFMVKLWLVIRHYFQRHFVLDLVLVTSDWCGLVSSSMTATISELERMVLQFDATMMAIAKLGVMMLQLNMNVGNVVLMWP